ncbi:cobyrinate a,c-diamide synthase [Comamonas flocculans]|uniref:Cobyrinate a,c-diamide synthase n=1 Tax=Comamonas flocculans TaxID=2597701 RepID=A0A5B8S036_9BURK|nr:cobyrinate a,c-diamide synthase [Comamonas flocculans]QEA13607.1 cobyrinate a,c-diamide synthase [Comamonas flocculans]
MVATCAALLVAAPASGQGKTTVVAALARLLARRGLAVRVFKSGPDFLDPFWHELASGQPVDNLDGWMGGEADVRLRLHAAARQAQVLLVEGVMGLHDGSPSSADLARRCGLPVLAVVQAGAMAQTLGAVAHGLRHYREAELGPLPWAGVLANGVASEGHARLLREALAPGDTWLGALPRSEAMQLPERHLGLVAARELGRDAALARLDAAADALAETPLGRLSPQDWRARWQVDFALPVDAPPAPQPLLAGRTVAVARDAAFSFIYPANVQALKALGARLVFFSPLAGEALPACDALWLPGGYPELHAPALAARTDLAGQLREHANAGKPIWAEGGGLLALGEALVTRDGQAWPMWGLLPVRAQMQPRLSGLGMQTWEGARAGSGLRGHAFHFARLQTALVPLAQTRPAPGSVREQGEAIHAAPGWPAVRGSFFHPWFASDPVATVALFTEAREPGARP